MVKLVPRDGRLRPVNSRQNSRVKELRKLFVGASLNQRGEIAVEGLHMVEEAIRSGLRIGAVLFSESAGDRAHKLLPQLSAHTDTLLLPEDVFDSAVPTETTQGIAAVVQLKAFELKTILSTMPALLVVAAGVQDPGNLGTIARSAEAFGATGLLLAERTVNPWNWKAVRASAGSLFRLPTVKVELAGVLGQIRERGIRVLATSSHKGTSITDVDFHVPVAFIVGSEGVGLPKDAISQADEVVAIRHSPRVESLNAGIAASIVLYEAARQRGKV